MPAIITTFSHHWSPQWPLLCGQSSPSHISCAENDCHQLQAEDLIVPAREGCWAWCPRFGSYSRSPRSAPHGLGSGQPPAVTTHQWNRSSAVYSLHPSKWNLPPNITCSVTWNKVVTPNYYQTWFISCSSSFINLKARASDSTIMFLCRYQLSHQVIWAIPAIVYSMLSHPEY